MESLKCWRLTTERGIKLARPSGPIARARTGGGRRHGKKFQVVHTFACPNEHGRIEAPHAELDSAPIAPTASSKPRCHRYLRAAVARQSDWELAFAVGRWVWGREKREEPDKGENEREPRRKLGIEVHPLALGQWNGEEGLRGERGRERRGA
jgi:hypothetical protein